MAKKKSRRGTSAGGRKTSRTAGRKKAARRPARKTTARRRPAVAKSKAAARKGGARKATARKATARKPAARKATARKAPARKAAARKTARAVPATRPARSAAVPKAKAAGARKMPALNRERRVVREDDIVPTPPSSLDMDRTASAARTGRRELHDRYVEHTETSPAITGGDVDADWESAYTVGDEAPGGDNPTPDQDVVDEIGAALGVQYADNEELKGEKKISDRDRHRWELDPASSEDYTDHDKD
jgi:hypothetical protein